MTTSLLYSIYILICKSAIDLEIHNSYTKGWSSIFFFVFVFIPTEQELSCKWHFDEGFSSKKNVASQVRVSLKTR